MAFLQGLQPWTRQRKNLLCPIGLIVDIQFSWLSISCVVTQPQLRNRFPREILCYLFLYFRRHISWKHIWSEFLFIYSQVRYCQISGL